MRRVLKNIRRRKREGRPIDFGAKNFKPWDEEVEAP